MSTTYNCVHYDRDIMRSRIYGYLSNMRAFDKVNDDRHRALEPLEGAAEIFGAWRESDSMRDSPFFSARRDMRDDPIDECAGTVPVLRQPQTSMCARKVRGRTANHGPHITSTAMTADAMGRSSIPKAAMSPAMRHAGHRSTCGIGGQMVTDEGYREIAGESRARRDCGGFDRCDGCRDLGPRPFGDTRVPCRLDGHGTDYREAPADPIDRPTRRLGPTAVETHGNTEVGICECSGCGGSRGEIHGEYGHRPHRGAEVIEDD